MADSSLNELGILRQMIQRLNVQLAKYTNVDGLNLLDPDSPNYPTSPWLTDASLLSPLLQEYDTHANELVSKIQLLKKENFEIKNKFQELDDENKRLYVEIQSNLENQVNIPESYDANVSRHDDLVKNLQAQLDLVTTEKEECAAMSREAMHQLDKFRHQQQTGSLEVASKLRSYDDISHKNDQLQETVLSMQLSLENLRNENKALITALREQESTMRTNNEELKETRLESNQIKLQHEEMEAESKRIKCQLNELSRELDDLKRNRNNIEQTNENYRQELTDAESKLAQALQAASNADSGVNLLKIEIFALQQTNSELEQKDLMAITKLRENGQVVENALLSRDGALQRERQAHEELQKTRDALETLVDEVAARVKHEVDKVRVQHAKHTQKFIDELQTMELEQSNLLSDVERLKREKRSVEEECERVAMQQRDEYSNNKLHDIHARMLIAERARDDSLINLQSLEDKYKRVKIEHENDRLSWMSKHDALSRTTDQLKRQLDENCHERMLLMETVNKHKNDLQKLDAESHSIQIEASKEVSKVKSEVGLKNDQLKAKIRSLEDCNNTEMKKLHHLLADQQRMTARWKEESQRCSEKYEAKIQQFKTELSRAKRRITELSNRLQKSTNMLQKTGSVEPELAEMNRTLRARLHETEYKLLSATEKIGQMHEIKTSLTLKDLQ